MWEPVGPLPAAVYQRRRRVALAGTTAGVLVVLLSTVLLLAPRAEDPAIRAERAAASAPQQVPSPAPSLGPLVLPSGTGAAGSGTPRPTAPATTSEELRSDETPRGAVPVPSPVPIPPTGPVPCTDGMIKVTAEIDSPTHAVGDRPVLRLVITNSSAQPCVRDLDPARQEIVVWSGDGKVRLWSSNDCGNPGGADLRTLVPQQPIVSAVTWAGRTSTPGCAKPRTAVPAGSYRVMSRLDGIISAPTPFVLR